MQVHCKILNKKWAYACLVTEAKNSLYKTLMRENKDIAKLLNIDLMVYIAEMRKYGAKKVKLEVESYMGHNMKTKDKQEIMFFKTPQDCKRAIEEFIEPHYLMNELTKKPN